MRGLTTGPACTVVVVFLGTFPLRAGGEEARALQDAAASAGIYSNAQAARGQDAFRSDCASCHPATDGTGGDGTAPRLTGPEFVARWADRPVGDILKTMRSTMPPSAPASLARETYLDILAYLLKGSGFPAGATDLGADPDALGRQLGALVPR